MKKFILITSIIGTIYAQESFFYSLDSKKEILTPVQNISRDIPNVRYFKTKDDVILGVSNKIIVKTKQGFDITKLEQKYSFKTLKKISKDMYLIEVKDNSLTLDTANSIDENDEIEFAHPDFIRKTLRR